MSCYVTEQGMGTSDILRGKKKNLDFPDSHKHCKNVSVVKWGGGEIRKGL